MIGRKKEIVILEEALALPRAELIAVYGRRRIGKTYMIKRVFEKQMVFECTGTINGSTPDQLANFATKATDWFGLKAPMAVPNTWREAFGYLSSMLAPILQRKKAVVIFDEFPWFNVRRSNFLQSFDYWWNTWASSYQNLTVVICGSAAAWMIEHVVNNKGGLHNRITRSIRLQPFTLGETEAFLQMQGAKLPRYQVAQLYMCTGGVPHYLTGITKGQSAMQAIQAMCFAKNGLLAMEFENLYAALFEHADKHIEIVKALARHPGGLTRKQIIQYCQISSGGGASRTLNELLESGFISYQPAFTKAVNEGLYHLEDVFTYFSFCFMAAYSKGASPVWENLMVQPAWFSWAEYAFERICQQHIRQIRRALQIGGVATQQSGWRSIGQKDKKQGAQIDLIIDRADQVINLCEIKFAQTEYVIDKAYAQSMLQKEQVFRMETKTRKALFTTLITPFGVAANEYKTGYVHSEVVLDAFFD
jgi:hypothetical protein